MHKYYIIRFHFLHVFFHVKLIYHLTFRIQYPVLFLKANVDINIVVRCKFTHKNSFNKNTEWKIILTKPLSFHLNVKLT